MSRGRIRGRSGPRAKRQRSRPPWSPNSAQQSPGGQPKAGAWQGWPYGYPLFHTHRSSTGIQWLTCASGKSFTDPYTGRHADRRRAGVIAASWHACPDRLRARGVNGQGTRQDPPHQGHPQAGPRRHARWQVPARAGPDGPPCTGHWRQGHGNGLPAEPSKPRAGTRCAGLALAPPQAGNCAVSGRQGGLAWGVCTRDQR
jgi:hypothetical protein